MIGAINGVLVAVFRYQPVIATLCTFFVLTGISLKIGATPKSPSPGTGRPTSATRSSARFPARWC